MLVEAWWRLIRFGFRLLYNELAWTYDLVSNVVSLGDWRRWQRAALPYLGVMPGERVLELAHGTGNLQIDLRTAGVNPVGLDLSPYMGAIARRKLVRHRILPRLVRGQAQALPFPAGCFPAVVSTFPTEFIIDPFTVGEVYRVLAPGGRFVIVINGLLTGGGVLSRLLEWAYRVTGQRGPWPGDPLRVFTAAGFALKQVEVPLARSRVLLFVASKAAN
ncbi:MAG: class I SAM-dependent methyltransferase [Anaerolineae bacterium]|nr:class I SAM-dependent methyltransferase [Anaerolineae bacterium]